MSVRGAIIFGFVAIGAAVGVISTLTDEWGLRIVMTTIGVIVGAALGGAASRIFASSRRTLDDEIDVAPSLGTAGDDLVENYWRDKGRAQLTSALEPEHGRHQFDPDRL